MPKHTVFYRSGMQPRQGKLILWRSHTGVLMGSTRPILAFARSDEGVALETINERAEMIFLLLTPSGRPRVQRRLLADIAGLFHSEYVTERLPQSHPRA